MTRRAYSRVFLHTGELCVQRGQKSDHLPCRKVEKLQNQEEK